MSRDISDILREDLSAAGRRAADNEFRQQVTEQSEKDKEIELRRLEAQRGIIKEKLRLLAIDYPNEIIDPDRLYATTSMVSVLKVRQWLTPEQVSILEEHIYGKQPVIGIRARAK